MSPSPFAIRGVIEGYYGRPWTHAQRLSIIDFLGERGMNVFASSPKDDPLLRRDWRVPLDAASREHLSELVDRCRTHEMGFMWCISPGLSIRYSDRADLEALEAKIRSAIAVGVTHIGLFLDDIPMELQHAADRAVFADLTAAHIALVGRVFSSLPAGVGLVVCPTVYWGSGTEPYVAALGRAIDPRIDLFWTGRAVCSATLDLTDAATFARTTGRPPTYWDNYPVNDLAMSYELHIGPYRGRDPHLWHSSTGIVANAMELFEASRIPLATIADYLQDPEGYDPEASWRRAMRDVAGEADLEAFALFADNVRTSCLSADDGPIVSHALDQALFELGHGDADRASRDLASLADRMRRAADHLLRGPVANPQLIEEVRPWLEGFELGALAIERMAELAADGRLEADGHELRPFLIRLRRARVRVFGDALEMTLSVLSGTMFRPGEVPVEEGVDP